MKENKIIGICCLIISVICLIGAYYFKVFEHEFLWNLALGIATGATLSMVIAIITFFLQKKERITELKADIKEEIEKYNIKTDFVKLKNSNSRINVKIVESGRETAINGNGPFIKQNYIESLYKKIENIEDGDILVLSGSVPKGIENDIYQNICKKLGKKDVKIIVDTTGDLLLKTLQYNPFLIKPNQEELAEIFNVKISSRKTSN